MEISKECSIRRRAVRAVSILPHVFHGAWLPAMNERQFRSVRNHSMLSLYDWHSGNKQVSIVMISVYWAL